MGAVCCSGDSSDESARTSASHAEEKTSEMVLSDSELDLKPTPPWPYPLSPKSRAVCSDFPAAERPSEEPTKLRRVLSLGSERAVAVCMEVDAKEEAEARAKFKAKKTRASERPSEKKVQSLERSPQRVLPSAPPLQSVLSLERPPPQRALSLERPPLKNSTPSPSIKPLPSSARPLAESTPTPTPRPFAVPLKSTRPMAGLTPTPRPFVPPLSEVKLRNDFERLCAWTLPPADTLTDDGIIRKATTFDEFASQSEDCIMHAIQLCAARQ